MTSNLLPAARVDFFALDAGTAATAAEIAADWRFTRVAVNIVRAGIEAAIAHYSANASPEMIIIETDDISDDFIAQLGSLAGLCAPGTDAVIIGPKNDVHLYRSLIDMGVRDYLVRPVALEDFVKTIAKSLIEKRGLSGSRLISVIGSKGGVGASTIAQILAWNIAAGLKQKTFLLDAAGSASNLGVTFRLEPTATLTESIRIGLSGSEDDLKRILQPAGENLSVLVTGGDPLLTDGPDADAVEGFIDRILQKHPVVVMDLSDASLAVKRRMLARASHVVAVTTPLLPSLRNARSLLAEIKGLRSGLQNVDLVINMRGGSGGEAAAKDIRQALDIEPAAVVQHLPKIFAEAETSGKPIGKYAAADGILGALMDICVKATGVTAKTVETKAAKAGLFGFLKTPKKTKDQT